MLRHTEAATEGGRPAGAPCAPMLAIAAAAGLACAHVAETAKPRRASPSRARKTIHMHPCMHARAPAAGGVRSGRAAECRLPIPVQRAAGARATTTRARRETPTPSGSIATKEKKNNPRTVMGARESVRVRGGRSARTLDRARNGRPEAAKPAAENVRAGKEAWAPMLLGPPLASPARDRSRSYRAAAAFSHGRCRPAGGPSLVPSQAAAGLVGRFARQKASTVDGLARRGGLAFLAVDSWLAAPPDWRRAHRGGEVGGDRPDPRPRPRRGGPGPAPRPTSVCSGK